MTVHYYIWNSSDLRNDLCLATELTRNGACAINLSVKVCCEHPRPVATNWHSHKCSGADPEISQGEITNKPFWQKLQNCSLKNARKFFEKLHFLKLVSILARHFSSQYFIFFFVTSRSKPTKQSQLSLSQLLKRHNAGFRHH